MEITSGIFKAAGNIYQNNKGSILRTIIYTIGHFAIAITVLMLVADVSFMIALTDAIIKKKRANDNYSHRFFLKTFIIILFLYSCKLKIIIAKNVGLQSLQLVPNVIKLLMLKFLMMVVLCKKPNVVIVQICQ